MHLEEALRLYENAMRTICPAERTARSVRVDMMNGHFRAGRIQAGETQMISLIGMHANDAELALMLPNIFVTALPDILSKGSAFFYHADGLPFRYGTRYSPAEYSCLYVERLISDPLPASEAQKAPLPDETPAKDILSCMWALLFDMMTDAEKLTTRARLEGHHLLELLPEAVPVYEGNVVAFQRHR